MLHVQLNSQNPFDLHYLVWTDGEAVRMECGCIDKDFLDLATKLLDDAQRTSQ